MHSVEKAANNVKYGHSRALLEQKHIGVTNFSSRTILEYERNI